MRKSASKSENDDGNWWKPDEIQKWNEELNRNETLKCLSE